MQVTQITKAVHWKPNWKCHDYEIGNILKNIVLVSTKQSIVQSLTTWGGGGQCYKAVYNGHESCNLQLQVTLYVSC